MIKLFWIFLFTITSSYANHIHWLGDYDKALSLAQKSGKPLLLLLTKHACKPCNKTIQKVLMNQPYIEELNRKFIAVIVTHKQKKSYPIELYYTTTFPTLFFVNSKLEQFLSPPLYGDEITTMAIQKVLHE
jgi:thioredoxin-related protein